MNGPGLSRPYNPMEPIPLLILGSGAMACMFAARLSSSGLPVAMVDEWQDGLKFIQINGVSLFSAQKSVHQNLSVYYPDNPIPSCQNALVLLKSWQTSWAAGLLKSCLASDGLALTLQNGLGNDVILKKELGEKRVGIGVTTLGATLVSPGKVNGFEDGSITLQKSLGIELLADIFRKAGYDIRVEMDLNGILWGKLIINAAVNPLSAIFEIPNGFLRDNPQIFNLLEKITAEGVLVSKSLNIKLPYTDPMVEMVKVLKTTAGNYSSMVQDMRRGAPTEIDYINGAIVDFGQKTGVPTPINQFITQMVKAKVIIKSNEAKK